MKRRSAGWAFLLVAVVLAAMSAAPAFPDPDSFYHAKIALFLRNGVILHTFPWFALTDWPTAYVDPHFLYHVLLVPFVTAFAPLAGMKVSAVVFGIVAFAAFRAFLNWLRAPYPTALALAAVLSPALLDRLSFPRAISLSLALFTAIAWAVLAKRPRLAFAFSALFVWLYHGWPTALLVLLAAGVAEIVAWHTMRSRPDTGTKGQAPYRVWVAVVAGLAFGIVTNPYFPELLSFSVVDIFKIGVVNQGYKISVGAEWQPASWWSLAATCWPAFLAWALSVGTFLRHATERRGTLSRDEVARIMATTFLAAGFVLLTLKSGRYVEYAVPCAVFAAGTLLAASRKTLESELVPAARRWIAAGRFRGRALAALVTLVVLSILGTQIQLAWTRTRYRADQYAFAVDWIRANVPADEVVFANTWDVGSVLFYLDDAHRSIVGLDPTFFYDADPELYARWLALVNGADPDVSRIPSSFRARTVLVDERHPRAAAFESSLTSQNFAEVAAGDRMRLYSCIPNDCQW